MLVTSARYPVNSDVILGEEAERTCSPLSQMHADFLPAWQRIYTNYSGQIGGGVAYDGNTGLVLPPWRSGTGQGFLVCDPLGLSCCHNMY